MGCHESRIQNEKRQIQGYAEGLEIKLKKQELIIQSLKGRIQDLELQLNVYQALEENLDVLAKEAPSNLNMINAKRPF